MRRTALFPLLAFVGCASLLDLGNVDYRTPSDGGSGGAGGSIAATGGTGGVELEPGDFVGNHVVAGVLRQRGLEVVVDTDDQTYLVGEIDGAVDIPPVRENGNGQEDELLLALDPQMKPLRSRSFGGTGDVELSLAVGEGGVFVAGGHRSIDLSPSAGITLDPPCTLPTGKENCAARNALVIKYDTEFDMRWFRDEGVTTDDELVRGIDLVDGDPVLLASYIEPQTLFDTVVPASPNRGCMVVRLTDLDDDAPIAWTQFPGDPDRDNLPRALRASDDRIAVLIDTVAANLRGLDVHVLDPVTGNFDTDWSTFTLEGDVRGLDLIDDGDGGYLVSALLVGPTMSPVALAPVGGTNGIILHLDAMGNLAEVWQWNGNVSDFDIARTENGSLIVAGTHRGDLVTHAGVTLPGDAGLDTGFVLELDPTGQVSWHHAFRGFGLGRAEIHDVAIGPTGDVVVVGNWAGRVNFGFAELESIGTPPDGRAGDANDDMITIRYAR